MVAERRSWVNRLCYLIFNGATPISDLGRPKPVDGGRAHSCRARGTNLASQGRPGVERVLRSRQFPDRGLAMADAVSLISVPDIARGKGIHPADLRFQISIPMVNSVVQAALFPGPDRSSLACGPGFEESLAAELAVTMSESRSARISPFNWDAPTHWGVQAVGAPVTSPG